MTFRDLHYDDLPLVLPNAWDVPSALALLAAGFPALLSCQRRRRGRLLG